MFICLPVRCIIYDIVTLYMSVRMFCWPPSCFPCVLNVSRQYLSGYLSYISPLWIDFVHKLHGFLVPVSHQQMMYQQIKWFTYMVNTIPPLRMRRPSLGTAPDQNVKMPSSLKILAAQAKLFLYKVRASIDCILLVQRIQHKLHLFHKVCIRTVSSQCRLAQSYTP